MTTATWLAIVTVIISIVGVVARWKNSRSAANVAKSATEVSTEILYQQLRTEYQAPEMQEAMEAIKQGGAGADEHRLVSHFFRAATDLLATGAINGALADNIRALQGKHLMKQSVIPWEQEGHARKSTSAIESKEFNERFLREFNLE